MGVSTLWCPSDPSVQPTNLSRTRTLGRPDLGSGLGYAHLPRAHGISKGPVTLRGWSVRYIRDRKAGSSMYGVDHLCIARCHAMAPATRFLAKGPTSNLPSRYRITRPGGNSTGMEPAGGQDVGPRSICIAYRCRTLPYISQTDLFLGTRYLSHGRPTPHRACHPGGANCRLLPTARSISSRTRSTPGRTIRPIFISHPGVISPPGQLYSDTAAVDRRLAGTRFPKLGRGDQRRFLLTV